MLRSSLFTLLVACGGGGLKDTAPPRPPEATCRTAAAHLADLVVSVQDPKPPDEAVNKLIDSTAQVCEQSTWSPSARACFSNVKTVEEADACTKELTPAQLETLGGAGKHDAKPEGAAANDEKKSAPPPPPGDPTGGSQTRGALPKDKTKDDGQGNGKTGDPCDGGE